jgi:hypothetical protein
MKEKLIHLVTRWDARQASRPNHNPYALGQYLAAVDTVAEKIAAGMSPERAIGSVFSDRLAAYLLKNIQP